MEIERLIDELEDVLEGSWGLPMSGGKVILNPDDIRKILEDIRLNLPKEIIQAQKVMSERSRIIEAAKTEAEAIIKISEDKIRNMVSQSEIVKSAQSAARDIISDADNKAKELKNSANEYIGEMMKKLDEAITQNLIEVRKARQALPKA